MDEANAERMIELVRESLGRLEPALAGVEIGLDDELASLNVESVTLLEVISALEEELQIAIPDDELTALVTTRDLVELLQKHSGVRAV